MSIRRIESSYATFLEDSRLSGTDMAVLVALSYVANEQCEEKCFPADAYLSKLTHYNVSAVRKSRDRLRANKVIDWVSGGKNRQGGNISNRYKFLFPHQKMLSRREMYQPMEDTPTLPGRVPYTPRESTLHSQEATNSERTPNRTSESNAEDSGVRRLTDFDVILGIGGVDKSISGSIKSGPIDPENISVVDEAMRVCKVNDSYNKRSFSSVILEKNQTDCLEEIYAFESEIRQGEHSGARNLAAILMARLKALPPAEGS